MLISVARAVGVGVLIVVIWWTAERCTAGYDGALPSAMGQE